MSTTERFISLLDQYTQKQLSPPDEKELFSLIHSGKFNSWLDLHILENLQSDDLPGTGLNPEKAKLILEGIVKQRAVVQMGAFKWRRIAAVAAILLFMAAGYWFLIGKNSTKTRDLAIQQEIKAPGSTKATLQLADGRIIELDSLTNGQLAIGNQQSAIGNDVTVRKQGDQIVYQSASTEATADKSAVKYNTLSNPRGSKVINVTLADGSKVWLNSESSLKYPTAFNGKERLVEVSGEAYFEVAHDASKPFKVNKGTVVVTVLGTHFNVNAYDDEPEIKVTLLEGSVTVSRQSSVVSRQSATLKPGEQATLGASGEWRVASGVDIEETMAWKEGKFSFNRTDIEVIMRQIARWYNVQVVYGEGVKGKDFTGDVDRKENISEVLRMLEMTGVVHFKVEGNKIQVNR